MAKRGNSVIGIDLGKHVFKGVLLQRKGDARYVLTSYASREVPEDIGTAEELAQQLKLLLKDIGGSAKGCAIAVSDPASLLRIIEQPDTPIDLLRSALRLNGLNVLNQECKDFVLDCAPVSANGHDSNGHANGEPKNESSNGSNGSDTSAANRRDHTKYLVGGMLRPTVKQISEATSKAKVAADILQLAPVCSFNAFELAYPEVFAKDTFLLLDMGHLQSTVMIGSKKELVLIRSIDYGGKQLAQALTADGALDANAARVMMTEGDAGMIEICRGSLTRLATEVRNSIGFFEGQREEAIHRIFVSGGLARTEKILQTLSDELGLPCEIWDPLETCEVALPAAKRQALPNEFVSLNVACGAAFEYLRN
ncbi:MAG TPA: pilus assembly protein PilM [Chthoniobacterales bacterium]|nr:pilus assembly protein PilM [Chthoniobacterales bacterium]